MIFGDSFASDYVNDPTGKSWHRVLADKLGIEEKCYTNYSLSGSSMEYSTSSFFKYVNSAYNKNDIIVLVMSSLNRSPLIHKEFPPGFASEMTRYLQGTLPKDNPAYEHYVQHNSFYKTWFTFKNMDLEWAQRFNLLMTLKHLPNTVIALSGFSHIQDYYKLDNLLESTETFLNIKPALFDISNDEIIGGSFYEFHKLFKGDPRNCHLTRTNNQILGNQLYECITSKSVSTFDKSQFKKKLIDLVNIDDSVLANELGPGYKRYMGL